MRSAEARFCGTQNCIEGNAGHDDNTTMNALQLRNRTDLFLEDRFAFGTLELDQMRRLVLVHNMEKRELRVRLPGQQPCLPQCPLRSGGKIRRSKNPFHLSVSWSSELRASHGERRTISLGETSVPRAGFRRRSR